MLTDGLNHVAIITTDMERFHAFYTEVFDAKVRAQKQEGPGLTLSFVDVGPHTELNVFQFDDGTTPPHTPMFGRGPIDHLALHASSIEAFETIRDRLIARGAADEFVTDFGPILSLFFRDPDGLECEVCVANPDARPGVMNPPGTPSARYVAET